MRKLHNITVFSFIILVVSVFSPVAFGQTPSDLSDFDADSVFSSFEADVKVNGSDGPLEVNKGERITVSWLTAGASRCRANFSKKDISFSGRVAGVVNKSIIIRIACINEARERLDDFVVVNVRGMTPAPTPTPPVVNNPPVISPIITVTVRNTIRPDITFQYQNIPNGAHDVYLTFNDTGVTVTSKSILSGSGESRLVMPDISPNGTYYLKVLAVDKNNALIAKSSPFTITVAPTVTTPTPAPSSKPLVCGQKGDVDGDGDIDTADREKVRQATGGSITLTDEESAAADVNGSGAVTALDSTLIYNYLTGSAQSFAGCVFVPKAIPPSCGIKGDVNKDGNIDNADIITIRQVTLGTGAIAEDGRMDISGDGNVTILDITQMRRYLLGLSTTFQACTSSTTPSASAGSLVMQTDATTPPLTNVYGGDTDVLIGKVQFVASREEDILLESIGLTLTSGSPADVVRVKLFDSGGQIGEGVFVSGKASTTVYLTRKLIIDRASYKTISIKADLAQIGIGSPGHEGAIIKIDVDASSYGVGQASGTRITASGSSSVSGVKMTARPNTTTAQPSITVSPLTLSVNQVLYLDIQTLPSGYYDRYIYLVPDGSSGDGTFVQFSGSVPDTKKTDAIIIPKNTIPGTYVVSIVFSNPGTVERRSLVRSGVFTVTTPVVSKPSPCGSLGDVNGDGAISQADVDLVRSFILGTVTPTDAQTKAADVNASGGLSGLDTTLVNGYLNGTYTTFQGCTTQPSTATTTVSTNRNTENNLASVSVPGDDVWNFLKAFFKK